MEIEVDFPKSQIKVSENMIRQHIASVFKKCTKLSVKCEDSWKLNPYAHFLQVKSQLMKLSFDYYILDVLKYQNNITTITTIEDWNMTYVKPIHPEKYTQYSKNIQKKVQKHLYHYVDTTLYSLFMEELGFKHFQDIPTTESFTLLRQELRKSFNHVQHRSIASSILSELVYGNGDNIRRIIHTKNLKFNQDRKKKSLLRKQKNLVTIKSFVEKSHDFPELRILDAPILYMFLQNQKVIDVADLFILLEEYDMGLIKISSEPKIFIKGWLKQWYTSPDTLLISEENFVKSIFLKSTKDFVSDFNYSKIRQFNHWDVYFLQRSYELIKLNFLKLKSKSKSEPESKDSFDMRVCFCSLCLCSHFVGTHIFTKFKEKYADKVNNFYINSKYTPDARKWIKLHEARIKLTSLEVLDDLFSRRYIPKKPNYPLILKQEIPFQRISYSTVENSKASSSDSDATLGEDYELGDDLEIISVSNTVITSSSQTTSINTNMNTNNANEDKIKTETLPYIKKSVTSSPLNSISFKGQHLKNLEVDSFSLNDSKSNSHEQDTVNEYSFFSNRNKTLNKCLNVQEENTVEDNSFTENNVEISNGIIDIQDNNKVKKCVSPGSNYNYIKRFITNHNEQSITHTTAAKKRKLIFVGLNVEDSTEKNFQQASKCARSEIINNGNQRSLVQRPILTINDIPNKADDVNKITDSRSPAHWMQLVKDTEELKHKYDIMIKDLQVPDFLQYMVTPATLNLTWSRMWFMSLEKYLSCRMPQILKTAYYANLPERKKWDPEQIPDIVSLFLKNIQLDNGRPLYPESQVQYINYTVFGHVQTELINLIMDKLNAKSFINKQWNYDSFGVLRNDFIRS